MLDEEFYSWFAKWKKTEIFSFPAISGLDDISFERLRRHNATELYQLFKNDDSPFINEQFKDVKEVFDYAKYLDLCGGYTAKHGSADWLFRFNKGSYIGVLHLYDLSLETFGQNHKRAWIGFATKDEFRRQGITSKVVRHFIQAILNYYPQIDFIHAMTDKNNRGTALFLKACGFLHDPVERLSKDDDFFIFSRPELS